MRRILLLKIVMLLLAVNTFGQYLTHPPHFPDGSLDAGMVKIVQDPDLVPILNSDGSWTVHFRAVNTYFINYFVNSATYPGCAVNTEIPPVTLKPRDIGVFPALKTYLDALGIIEAYDQKFSLNVKFGENSAIHVSFPEATTGEVVKTFFVPILEPILFSLASDYLKKSSAFERFQNLIFDGLQATSFTSNFDDALSALELNIDNAPIIAELIIDGLEAGLPTLIENTMMQLRSENLVDFDPSVTDFVAIASSLIQSKLTNAVNGGLVTDIIFGFTKGAVGSIDLQANQDLVFCVPVQFLDTRPQFQSTLPADGSNIAAGVDVSLGWNFTDLDNDVLEYDLFMKSPNDLDFVKIEDNFSEDNFLYQPFVNGLYQWKVIAHYDFPSVVRRDSPVSSFTVGCPTINPLTISTSDFEMICAVSGHTYDLKFAFIGDFDPSLAYNGTFSYVDSDGAVVSITKAIVPNVSDPQNIVTNLPNDINVEILISDGCNTASLNFNPYPDIAFSKELASCTALITLLENGSMDDYDIEVNSVETNLQDSGDQYESVFDGFGFRTVIVNMSPIDSDCYFQRVYSFTCLVTDLDCPITDVTVVETNCDESFIKIDLTSTEDHFYSARFNEEEILVLDGAVATIPFLSYGSPEVSLTTEKLNFPACLNQLNVAINCPLEEIFLTDSEMDTEALSQQAQICGLPEGYFNDAKGQELSDSRSDESQDLPTALILPLQQIVAYQSYIKAKKAILLETYGDLYTNDNFDEYRLLFEAETANDSSLFSDDSTYLIQQTAVFDFEESSIASHINVWNRSIDAWSLGILSPTEEFFNIINKTNINYHQNIVDSISSLAFFEGFSTPEEMYQSAIQAINDYSLEDDPNENAVCASVSINLSQTLTMTREAFEGTLTIFNGSTDGPMDSVELELIILDSDGVVSNDLFEIETTGTNKLTAINGTGVLAADTEGSASVLFIPEIGAAPTVPKPYSFGGNLSYIDPFSGLKVTMPLIPVTLTVNPSPDLFLHYFLERDVLGDDLFTSEVEPSVPAKLGLMIENNGYGEATNVRIESAQPQVVDNEQGLALNMNLIGTRLEGQDATMGLANINFGNVDPLDTKVGEWLFTSDHLGHFTGYETNLIHSDSRGNPDLSLISGIELHELIRSINVYGGLDDNIEDFLVNEVPDANDHPDAIYLTQGNTVYDVAESFIGEFIGDIVYPNFTNTLSFDPVDSLWNYIELDDPGNGDYDVVSVTRDSDGFLLPITNAWLTYVTIPDSKVQVYENKFHIVDDVLAESVQTYTVVWSPKDPNPPAVDTIIGAPSTVAYVPVSTLEIIFTEEINDSTFTYEDISLMRQGGNNLIDSTIAIVKIDSVSYSVDISDYTLEDGFYVFICQAAGVTDLTGSPGLTGKQVSWTQALAAPAIISFDPDIDGQVISSLDSLDLVFNIPIDTSSFDLNDVIITKDAVPLDLSSITLSLTNSQLKNFRLSDLASIINLNADYTIAFDLAGITSTTNKVGTTIQSISFTVDDIAPTVVQIEKIYDGGLDHQHVTGMRLVFSEEIESLTPASLQLTRDALDLSIQPFQVSALSNNTYEVYWTAIKSYADGNYDFGIDMSQIYDLAGNAGAGISQKIWLVDRIPSLVIDNLSIAPDYGFSDSDALTYNRSFDLSFDINEYAQEIKIYQNDNGELILLEGVDSLDQGSYSYSTTLLTGGNTGIKITALDSLRNPVEASLTINIDESPLTGNWIYNGNSDLLAHPDSLVFVFNKAVLDTENIPISSIAMLKDNVPVDIGVLNIGFVNSTTLKLSNLNALPLDFGRYTLSIDLTQYHKYSSGISGFSDKAMSYTIFDPNRSPVAIASQDTVVQTGSTVVVSALASYDPDGDQLSYIWYAPDIVQLSDSTAASPSFLVTNDMAGLVLTLLLSVSDGSKVATDIVRVYVSADDIIVVSKVLLQGPYDPDLGKMNDLLRSQSHLPLEGPYINETLYKYNDPKISTQIVFDSDSGNNIVDWVYLELVDMVNDSAIAGGMYLIKQEGQIVDVDGFSPPKFSNIDEGSYSLAIYHRNHLPIRTNENLVIQANSLESIDLTQNVDQILGTINAVHQIAGTYTMIAGDVDENGQIQQSDINQSRPKIGVSGYHVEDVDMNGEIQNTDIQLKILPNLGRGKQF